MKLQNLFIKKIRNSGKPLFFIFILEISEKKYLQSKKIVLYLILKTGSKYSLFLIIYLILWRAMKRNFNQLIYSNIKKIMKEKKITTYSVGENKLTTRGAFKDKLSRLQKGQGITTNSLEEIAIILDVPIYFLIKD